MTKNENFLIQDGGRPPYWKSFFTVTQQPIVRKQNRMAVEITWRKLQIFKIQDDGRLLSWKSLKQHNLVDFNVI